MIEDIVRSIEDAVILKNYDFEVNIFKKNNMRILPIFFNKPIWPQK
jgi:hypothetical protein